MGGEKLLNNKQLFLAIKRLSLISTTYIEIAQPDKLTRNAL